MEIKTFVISNTLELTSCFKSIQSNPYSDYATFYSEVSDLIGKNIDVLADLRPIKKLFTEVNAGERKIVLIKGCPIDEDVPIYDHNDPVGNKYITKKTFISEVFLAIFSQFCELPILSYTTRNNGDFFQDVYAHNKYCGTQTQKTDSELYYHNDRTAHKVRADLLCLLGVRSDPENIVNTKYIHGVDLLKHIDLKHQEVLRQNYFVTPFDLISQDSNELQESSEIHSILMNESTFRYYDLRTIVADGAPEIAYRALLELRNAITKVSKVSVSIQKGEMFVFPNLDGLHSRDISYIKNKETALHRYLLKTYNFWSNSRRDNYSELFVDGLPGLVNDALINS